ncbi:tlde1 domain-containing protein [uncultured Roseibium sp.]|uniref:tlde1 domain-containing protein n=1 Tax=uncultured Roseibium sp. TaxID=1936171 RepID=UPI00259A2107|nr:tlde1 domain-containing protein [uncultured Roseibium sp.]
MRKNTPQTAAGSAEKSLTGAVRLTVFGGASIVAGLALIWTLNGPPQALVSLGQMPQAEKTPAKLAPQGQTEPAKSAVTATDAGLPDAGLPRPREIAAIIAQKARQHEALSARHDERLEDRAAAQVSATVSTALAEVTPEAIDPKVAQAEQDAKAKLRRLIETRQMAGLLTFPEANAQTVASAEPTAGDIPVDAVVAAVASLEPTDDLAEVPAESSVALLEAEPVPVPGKRPAAPKRRIVKPRDTAAPASATLAYARDVDPRKEGDGIFSGLSKVFNSGEVRLPGRGSGIAVYDISAAIVYMPDGTKLEAHSGIGKMLDNPRYTKVRNNGPTPPNIYNLRMRERRFHGVEAIRMLPVDVAAMHGRDGMLTHTPLLRGRIGSHGCVAFKDYNKFLRAFKAGKVKKMIVVPKLEKLPVYMAAL